ncbi:MAG: hypothetical protein ACI88L_000690 [Candidatus Paceibacteria bacterium]|jgi:hypothetical protein
MIMNTKGYTLLFTVLITGIILSIALGISRISYTEAVLSSAAREGAKAFFAADTGFECAILHDLDDNAFSDPSGASFDCSGDSFSTSQYIITPLIQEADERFSFFVNTVDNTCAKVHVYKAWNTNYTRVESFGYNKTCEEVDPLLNPTANFVERALGATYLNEIDLSPEPEPPVDPTLLNATE